MVDATTGTQIAPVLLRTEWMRSTTRERLALCRGSRTPVPALVYDPASGVMGNLDRSKIINGGAAILPKKFVAAEVERRRSGVTTSQAVTALPMSPASHGAIRRIWTWMEGLRRPKSPCSSGRPQ